jgi:hypothetical protein
LKAPGKSRLRNGNSQITTAPASAWPLLAVYLLLALAFFFLE